ncbi:hypothetical protein RirG_007950 [Rhizophagus irregularis DAOM 197198w]|uniref:RING-type domain-containing protein n=1 Tax=Rhizophagus irregularis (strain DAOM 197198w) TaxID=1432141 RepID=A0A015M2J9_RHIIW|nr:hypothetical protein RirG_007950 [Rhizophagus irregularis DAOM 197198w]
MENQKSSVNTKATTVDEINIGPIGNTQSREESSISESERPSLVSLDDKTVSDIDFPELELCSECNNDILTFPLREFTRLRCGHIFHRLCAEKKLMLNNIEITEIFSTIVNYPIGQLPESNVIIQDSPLFQSSRTLALTNMMSKRRMEGVENIGTQQMGSQLRCVKCSENLSLYLPPLGFLRTFSHPPPKPLVYLTCKHIIHYNCIDNPGKLCPICPSTDMEIDDDDMVAVAQESNTQKKCIQKSSTEKSSSKKRKTSNKDDVSTVLKKLIEELLTPDSGEVLGESNVSDALLNTRKFLYFSDMIDQAEIKNKDATQNVINRYFDFGEVLYLQYKELKPSCGKDGANALVKEEVRKQIPEIKFSDDALRKRMERAGKVYKLFNSIDRTKIV